MPLPLHPLDPLTADAIGQAVEIVRGWHGGGLDLYAKVGEMAERLEARFRGEMSCQGHESMGRYSQSCLRGFTVDISIEYGDS